ncbi:MAG: hypothetical protein K6G83_11440 [Lachnospiraceae bacterium]|nr:hypothetical protein [Lachnospiraceae bacterium]
MEAGKALQNAGRSATGSVVKAVLCIRSALKLQNVAQLGEGEKDDGLTDEDRSAVQDVAALGKDLLKRTEQSLKGGSVATFDAVMADAASHGYIALEMQYNPNTLRLDTSAGLQVNYSGSADTTELQSYVAPASTTLSCEFLFDDVNNMDAFMLGDNPLTNMTPTNIGNAALSAAKGDFSVQTEMEGLLSLLSMPQARHVVFFWGNMSFRGEVTQVDTEYTMFNKKGFPVRGIVRMQIRQGDATDENDSALKYEEDYWTRAFETGFTDQKQDASLFSQITNNSMLNLKL